VHAQLLGAYLQTAACATMIGLFELPPAAIVTETAIPAAAIAPAFDVLQTCELAAYDEASSVVWVFEMAKTRLGLTPDRPALTPGDKKVIMANRLYAGVVDNPFLEPFWTVYRDALHLNRLRQVGADPQNLRQLSFLARSEDQRSEDQRSEKACGNVDRRRRPPRRSGQRAPRPRIPVQAQLPSFGIYSVIARESVAKALLENPHATVTATTTVFQRLCDARRLQYTPDVAARAIAVAIATRSRT
jgi:hypothetical protein